MQVQLDRMAVELKEAVAGRASAQESAELMRERAEHSASKLAELRNELHSASAAAAEEVCTFFVCAQLEFRLPTCEP